MSEQHVVQPRQVKIPFAVKRQRFWCYGLVFPTLLMNAFTIYAPIIERYMLRKVRPLMDEITDPELKKEVEAFVLQEGVHAREHERSKKFLEDTGFRVGLLYTCLEFFIDKIIDPLSELAAIMTNRLFPLAAVAGAEHWTALTAEVNMSYEKFEKIEDSPMLWLFAWHGAEEIEHKSVVYNLMEHLNCPYWLRILSFVVVSTTFLFMNIFAVLVMFFQLKPREIFRQELWVGAFHYLFIGTKTVPKSITAFFDYMRRDHHPDQRDNYHLVEVGMRVANRGKESGLTMDDLVIKSKA